MQARSDAFSKFIAVLGLAAVLASVGWWRSQDENLVGAIAAASASQAELVALISESRIQSDAATMLMKRTAEVMSLASEFRDAHRVTEANRVLDTLPTLSQQLTDHMKHAAEFQVQARLKRVEADRLDAYAAVQRRFAQRREMLSIAGLAGGMLLLALGCFGWGRGRNWQVMGAQAIEPGR